MNRLLIDLEPLTNQQVEIFLKDGLIGALDRREIKKQQRLHSTIKLDQVEEKVMKLVTKELEDSFGKFECISKGFGRQNSGYIHNPYLCLVAA